MTTPDNNDHADPAVKASITLMPTSQAILDAITPYSVALLASKHKDGSHPYVAGSGTLVTTGAQTFILTARHVWTEVLAKAVTIGFPYRDLEGKVFLISRDVFTPMLPPVVGIPYDPDFCFIKVPTELVPRMEALSRVKYNLKKERPLRTSLASDSLAAQYTVCGVPGVMTHTTADAVDFKHYCYTFISEPIRHGEGYQYLEFSIFSPGQDVPQSFKGVSGGGLWRIIANPTADTDTPEYYLAGVAYEESNVIDGLRHLRFIGIDRIAAETEALLHEKIWTPLELT